MEGINRRITNIESLVKDFGSSSEDKRTLAQYIIGENDAFDALTEAESQIFLLKQLDSHHIRLLEDRMSFLVLSII